MNAASIIQGLAIAAVPILIAVTFHEVAHGWVANRLGDPTARFMGRLTFNPLAHIDPVGTILVPIMLFVMSSGSFVFGSAKPVPVNFGNLGNPRRDSALVALAGPATNVILAILSIVLLLVLGGLFSGPVDPGSLKGRVLVPLVEMVRFSITFNIFIAAFNLIPIPPLDGGRIMMALLPGRHAFQLGKLEPYGIVIVLALWFTGLAKFIIGPIHMFIAWIVRAVFLPFGGI